MNEANQDQNTQRFLIAQKTNKQTNNNKQTKTVHISGIGNGQTVKVQREWKQWYSKTKKGTTASEADTTEGWGVGVGGTL